MDGNRRLALLVALALALTAISAAPAPAQATSAAMSRVVSGWLATASRADTFETIITFKTRLGMRRIDGLDVGAVKLRKLPIAFATLSAAQMRTIAGWPEVRSLWHNQQQEILLDESVAYIGADKVARGVNLRRPYTGQGVGVAVIDTGVDGLHPDLPYGTKVEQYALAGNPFDKHPMTFTPTATGDTYGHGTHVSSTIAGTGAASGGRFAGVAPGAKIYSFKTDVGAVLLDSYILAAFDWILYNPGKIQISSNSWGCCSGANYDPNDPINVATKALHRAGVTVVFSAGNAGGPNTLNPYSASPYVLGVAAGTKDGALATFSSRGRLKGNWDRVRARRKNVGIYRPSVTAPGVEIEAAKSSQAAVMAGGTDPENPMYTYADGTSMAAPHVAGVIALMLEARPRLKPRHIIDIIEGTATNMPAYELFEAGTGYLNAHAAVRAAERGRIKFPPIVNGRTPEFVLSGSTDFSGTVLPNTWAMAQCPDTTGLLSHHQFEVTTGADVVFAEIEWDSPTQLIYLVLYNPSCEVVAQSAALLDIGEVNYRAVLVTRPVAGTWTVAVYGRINIPYPYTGSFKTYDKR